jgi:hypothetical protein
MSAKKKFEAIESYLKKHFPDSTIKQKDDFDRGAQTFKVQLTDSTLLLKVGGELTEDYTLEEILRLFDQWTLADLLRKETELGVLVTRRGLETFRRGT